MYWLNIGSSRKKENTIQSTNSTHPYSTWVFLTFIRCFLFLFLEWRKVLICFQCQFRPNFGSQAKIFRANRLQLLIRNPHSFCQFPDIFSFAHLYNWLSICLLEEHKCRWLTESVGYISCVARQKLNHGDFSATWKYRCHFSHQCFLEIWQIYIHSFKSWIKSWKITVILIIGNKNEDIFYISHPHYFKSIHTKSHTQAGIEHMEANQWPLIYLFDLNLSNFISISVQPKQLNSEERHWYHFSLSGQTIELTPKVSLKLFQNWHGSFWVTLSSKK